MTKNVLKQFLAIFILMFFVSVNQVWAENAFECKFEKDTAPKISLENENKYKKAENFYKDIYENETKSVDENYKDLFKLMSAGKDGDWRLKYALANHYLLGAFPEGLLTEKDADKYFNQMVKNNIPAGYYGKFLMDSRYFYEDFNINNAALESLKKGAELGSPMAQYDFGRYTLGVDLLKTIYEKNDFKVDLKKEDYDYAFQNLVCSLRQGFAEPAVLIGDYLMEVEKNYPMALNYYLIATSYNHDLSSSILYITFSADIDGVSDIKNDAESFGITIKEIPGYKKDKKLAEIFENAIDTTHTLLFLYDLGPYEERIYFVDFNLPKNNLLNDSGAYKKESKLKDAFGGKWPHEIYTELNFK